MKVGITSKKSKSLWPFSKLRDKSQILPTVKYVEKDSSATYHIYTFTCTVECSENEIPKMHQKSMEEYAIPVDIL